MDELVGQDPAVAVTFRLSVSFFVRQRNGSMDFVGFFASDNCNSCHRLRLHEIVGLYCSSLWFSIVSAFE